MRKMFSRVRATAVVLAVLGCFLLPVQAAEGETPKKEESEKPKKDESEKTKKEEGEKTKNEKGEKTAKEHGEKAPEVPAMKVAKGDWCGGCGVPESICSRCSKAAADEYKKKGDWCKKHDRAESQCFICHPTLKDKWLALKPKE